VKSPPGGHGNMKETVGNSGKRTKKVSEIERDGRLQIAELS
jgi:hypothetical protein